MCFGCCRCFAARLCEFFIKTGDYMWLAMIATKVNEAAKVLIMIINRVWVRIIESYSKGIYVQRIGKGV